MIDTALIIFPVYGALTLVLWAALAMAGEGSFVALITAMGVVSTSGIAAEAGGVAQQSGWLGEVMIFIALIVAPFAAYDARARPVRAANARNAAV
ncbi:MAG: hypothetical protein U5N55_10880 [Cypionkella sp.]|nr:hypothetical protein [Cypionkella sp.]